MRSVLLRASLFHPTIIISMEQHPVPQNVTTFQFRLIGDMTIKQFASLGISIVLAIITYSLPVPFFFKYPLSFILLCLGVGMAFVPVQGRSLDIWILAFIKSIYSPTQYSWKRTEEVTADTIIPTGPNHAVQAQTNARIEISRDITSSAPTPVISTPAPEEPKTVSETTEPKLPETISTAPTAPETPKPVETRPTTVVTAAAPAPLRPIVTPPVSQPPIPSGLPIPFTPGTPNTLVGLTLNPEGKILDGVMVEIQKNGLTSRATKSNKLGQFMFARPLENGTYQILAERDTFTFAPYSLELTGQIIRPLKIQAQ